MLTLSRRALLLSAGALAGCTAVHRLPRRGGPRGRAGARAHPRPDGSDLRHRGLPAAVPRGGTEAGCRACRRHPGGAQLRSWRQRLVALLGLRRRGGAQGDGEQSARGRGHRLRRSRAHRRDPRAARRREGHDLRARAAAADAVGPSDGGLDAGLAHRARRRRAAGFCGLVGRDGAHGLQDAPGLSRPARRSRGMDRLLFRLVAEDEPGTAAPRRHRIWTSPNIAGASPIWSRRRDASRPTRRRFARTPSIAART